MFKLKVRESFESAHFLRDYEGKCARLHGHGYKIEATFLTKDVDQVGLGCDFAVLRERIKGVIDPLDHQNLNELACFQEVNPSAENIAKYVYEQLKKSIRQDSVELDEVAILETDHYCASFRE